MLSRIIDTCPGIFYTIIKALLYTFTFLLLLFGLSLIGFSFWYLSEDNEYHLDATISLSVSAVTFVSGFLLLTISACGLIGALRENMMLSKIFLCGMIVLMSVELASVSAIYLYKKQILNNANEIFEGFINSYVDDDDVRTIVDTVQSNLHCCGITSADDWDTNIYYNCASISTLACSVPASCCRNYTYDSASNNFFCGVGIRNNATVREPKRLVYLNGCKFEIYRYFERKQNLIIIVYSAALIPQLCGLLLIIGFIFALKGVIQAATHAEIPYIVEFNGHKYNPYHYRNNFINNYSQSNNVMPYVPSGNGNGDKFTQSYHHSRIYNDI